MRMGEPCRMKTHYADTIDFDWASHFVRQADSGLNVRQYCKLNQCSRSTWYHVKKQYDECEDKANFKHTKQRTGVEPLLSGTVNTGLINETVKRRLLDKYGVEPDTLSKPYAVKISKQLGFF